MTFYKFILVYTSSRLKMDAGIGVEKRIKVLLSLIKMILASSFYWSEPDFGKYAARLPYLKK